MNDLELGVFPGACLCYAASDDDRIVLTGGRDQVGLVDVYLAQIRDVCRWDGDDVVDVGSPGQEIAFPGNGVAGLIEAAGRLDNHAEITR